MASFSDTPYLEPDQNAFRELSTEEIDSVSGGLIPLVLIFAYGFTSGAAAMGLGLWLASGRN